MQTLKEVLGRKEERQNLRNVGFSILIVVLLVGLAFGIVGMKPAFNSTADTSDVEVFTSDALN